MSHVHVSTRGHWTTRNNASIERQYGMWFGLLMNYIRRIQTLSFTRSTLENSPWERFVAATSPTACTHDAATVSKRATIVGRAKTDDGEKRRYL